MVTPYSDDGDVSATGAILKVVEPQLQHAAWHGWQPHHWHVGVTALDTSGRPTEHVEKLIGYPVYRVMELDRAAIRLIPREISSCHWPDGHG